MIEDININHEQTNENDVVNVKKDKTSLILFIIGTIFFVLALIVTAVFGFYVLKFFATADDQRLGVAFGLIIIFVYLCIPSIALSVLTNIFYVVSFCKSKKHKALKLTFMIISIVVTILSVLFTVLVNFM